MASIAKTDSKDDAGRSTTKRIVQGEASRRSEALPLETTLLDRALAERDSDYLVYRLRAPESLTSMSLRIWGTSMHADMLLANNPAITGVDVPCPAETVIRIPTEIVYRVRRGDSLSGIAERLLGDRRLHSIIAELNRGVINDATRIEPGLVINIPLTIVPAFDR